MNVAIFGLGYVGSVTAACLAQTGHRIVGVDHDEFKVESIRAGRSPFFEPGLDELIAGNRAAGRLTATTSAEEALAEAEAALVCVGTPSERNGNLSLDQLRRVVAGIAECLRKRPRPLILAIRSTVFPGTCEQVVIPEIAGCEGVTVVSNPEFLREGVAVKDFVEPGLVVVGGSDPASVRRIADLYESLPVKPCLVSLRTAEMIKYACNAFHAVKIAFANEVGALSDALQVDADEVMATLCTDDKLNTSAAYLKPGFAFGGSCLPKDLRALNYRARQLDVRVPMLESVLPANDAQLKRATDAVLDRKEARIGILGLAFKEDTDDLRESPVVSLLEQLIGKGRDIRIHDPCISIDGIYGANRNFILNAIPHIGRLMLPKAESVLEWAQCLVIAQKPSPDLVRLIVSSGLPVVNLVGSSARLAARLS